MKHYLTLLLWTLWGFTLHAQSYRVSTEPQQADVLMEVFTGVKRNDYSNLGLVENMKQIYGDCLHIVTIHAGTVAYLPDQPEYDYRIEAGQEISRLLDAEMPGCLNAGINRQSLDIHSSDEYAIEPLYWVQTIDKYHAETAPINLWAEAEYDGNTRKLHVRVEGYCVAQTWRVTPLLNVMLLQNNVMGIQEGAPNHVYEHQHMLRATLTDNFGEVLSGLEPQKYFSREFTYRVPEKVAAVPFKAEDLEIVLFVTDGIEYEVMNSLSLRPTYKNLTIPLQGRLYPDRVGLSDDFHLPVLPFELENRSDAVLTSARFSVALNGNAPVIREWTGEIRPFGRKPIEIPALSDLPLEDENRYVITLLEMNGQPVEAATLEYTFNAPNLVLPTQLIMTLKTAYNTAENEFKLHDLDAGSLQTFGPYADRKQYEEKLELIPGHHYCLEVTNEKMHHEWLNLQLCNTEGVPLVSRDRVSGFGYRIFFRTLREGEKPIEKCNVHIYMIGNGDLYINDRLMRRVADETFLKSEELHLQFKAGKNYGLKSFKIDDKECVGQVRNQEYTLRLEKDVDLRVEFEYGTFTGLNEVADDGLRVYSEKGRLVVEGLSAGQPVSIYSLDGKLLFSFNAQSETLHIDLPKGQAYLVRTQGQSHKVVL